MAPLATLARTALAVTATAAAGGLATSPDSTWYTSLAKPSWQPPPQAFGLVWTPLYATIAAVSARTLDRTTGPERAAYRRALAANLALNAGWSAVFFRSRRPWLAAAESTALTLSSADLVRRTARSGARRDAAILAAYPAWCAFATALTVAIARRNPGRRA